MAIIIDNYLNGLPSVPAVDTLIGVKDGVVKNITADSFAFNNRFVHKIRTIGGTENELISINLPEGEWIFVYVVVKCVSQPFDTSIWTFILEDFGIYIEDEELTTFSGTGNSYKIKIGTTENAAGTEECFPKISQATTYFQFIPTKSIVDGGGENTGAIFDHYFVFERIA